MALTRKEYCYMYFSWCLAICVIIWYLHTLITLPEKNMDLFENEKGDL
jgi:hypothetical protein